MRHALIAEPSGASDRPGGFFILADIPAQIGWVGVDSIVLMAVYVVGIRLLQSGAPPAQEGEPGPVPEGMPRLVPALVGFGLAAGALVVATPFLVRSSVQIAEITGVGAGFVGTLLVALVTSLPELVTTIAAARIGAYDLAVGNLFGSNAFNIFALGFADLFYLPGRFLGAIDPAFALVALLGLILTMMGLIGNLVRLERRFFFVELDALALVVVYFAGMLFLYTRGIGV